MTTKTPPTKERIESRRVLGVDAKGYTHRWDGVSRSVYVFDGDEFLGTFDIGDGPLSEHVATIREAFGPWQSLYFSPAPFGSFARIKAE